MNYEAKTTGTWANGGKVWESDPKVMSDRDTCPSPYTATLTFDLAGQDGRTEFEFAYAGKMTHLAVWEFDRWLRDQIKYRDKEEYQPVRDALYSILDEYRFDWDIG